MLRPALGVLALARDGIPQRLWLCVLPVIVNRGPYMKGEMDA
jgi:hypothetical protein